MEETGKKEEGDWVRKAREQSEGSEVMGAMKGNRSRIRE